MTNHSEAIGPTDPSTPIDQPVVTLRTPAELADALPYLLGFKPENSIVLIALHGERGRFGGRVRLGIPERAEDWASTANQLAQCLVGGCERRGSRPEGIVAFLCREPTGGESGKQVVDGLRSLAQLLRTACGGLDVPVVEVVCISGGRFWTYCCPDTRCCPPEGIPLLRPGTSVLAAAATYMGVQVSSTQSELRARLTPWETAAAVEQERALDTAGLALIPKMLGEEGSDIAIGILDLARRVMARLAAADLVTDRLQADNRDDELLAHDEAAALILGLQVRTTRDRAAAWMEGDAAPAALRLWRALARRCVGAYGEHAAAPLALAGWVAWSLGDSVEGQEALDMALGADPDYLFAQLLNRACNDDLDPEPIRRLLRRDHGDQASELLGADEWLERQPLECPEGQEPLEDAEPTPPRRRRRRLPHAAGGGGRTSGGGTWTSNGPGTGPRNRRRTIRRGARNGR
ncbi:DUF4192 domain-containing protein [Streptomyces kanamyceticus]|uniref:DUF4192 domain-containing protein n=1 Tax=Streptomyces kanamyceticus TaxID=1967 RepID=A0A5J6G8N8_STRKN|nr:DUF4192 domain-containing protein [Streptomyces kanamyceticus]QEU91383.1 DUF4192 domain-containing protein [Streptomyces kanamyceticus]